MWKGRFQQETDELLREFSESVSFDQRLAAYDVRGSKAHAGALLKAGILTVAEHQAICEGLDDILASIQEGTFQWRTELEDVHMNIEAELTRRIGDAGAKLHTARSRNDQVATDFRMYCREETREILKSLRVLQAVLVDFADGYRHILMPGYTHLQRAQPVPVAHYCLAYVEMLERDAQRFGDGLKRINVLPLGSGAIAGSTIVLDREPIARELGFDGISRNSMDAVSDRDFACELLFAIALTGVHLSRLSEDVVLWASAEFGFLVLSDGFTTGSSLMPQKRNPDVAELTRGKSGRLLGNLVALLTVLKGLPMTYNRDLQEDKERVFDSVDTLKICLRIFAKMLSEARLNEKRIAEALADPLLLATDLVDVLVLNGVPFRKAHEHVGRLVARVEQRGVTLKDLSPSEFREECDAFGDDPFAYLDLHRSMRMRTAPGAPAPANVDAEIRRWKSVLAAA